MALELVKRFLDTDDNPRIIFVSLTNDVGVERVIGAMARHGARCALLSAHGSYCSYTRFIERSFLLPRHRGMWLGALFVRSALESVVRRWSPDVVIPLDDVASWLLRGLATSRRCTKRLRSLLLASLGAPDGYLASCRRLELMRVAAALGILTPEFDTAGDIETALQAAKRWGFPLVLKEEFSWCGHGVSILESSEQLRNRLETRREGAGKRLHEHCRHLVWSLAGLQHVYDPPPVLQTFVSGRLVMRTVSTWHGRVLEGASFAAERVHPAPNGTSSVVRFIDHQGMQDAARLLVERLGCSGIVSFDFMLDERSGRAYLIDMNARPIVASHLGQLFGHDLCGGLIAHLRGEKRSSAESVRRPPKMIAMFPTEVERYPDNLQRLLTYDVLHDVPSDDPGLVAAYLRRLAILHPKRIDAIKRSLPARYVEGEADTGARLVPGYELQQPAFVGTMRRG